MLELDDPRWKTLQGGYRVPYDASIALGKLKTTSDPEPVWEELWNELHHQGDVGEASHAAVPQLVRIHTETGRLDWNLYALVSVIEIERHAKQNPPLPEWMKQSYELAWKKLIELGLRDLQNAEDELTVRSILGAIALGKGLKKLGGLLTTFDSDEIEDLYARYRIGDRDNEPPS